MRLQYAFDVGRADTDNPQGCGGAGHDISCLCDVDLALSPAFPPTGPVRVHSGLESAAGFYRWAEGVAARTEALSAFLGDVSVDEIVEHAEQVVLLQADFTARAADSPYTGVAEKNQAQQRQRGAVHDHVCELLRHLDVGQVACMLDVTPEEVVTLAGYHLEDAPAYIQVDREMRTRVRWGMTELANEFGLNIWQVENWSCMTGMRPYKGASKELKERALELLDDRIDANSVCDILATEFPDEPRVQRGTLYNWKCKAKAA